MNIGIRIALEDRWPHTKPFHGVDCEGPFWVARRKVDNTPIQASKKLEFLIDWAVNLCRRVRAKLIENGGRS